MNYFSPHIHITSVIMSKYEEFEIRRLLESFALHVYNHYNISLYSVDIINPNYVILQFINNEPSLVAQKKVSYNLTIQELKDAEKLKMTASYVLDQFRRLSLPVSPYEFNLKSNEYLNKNKKLLLL